ncbi:MAG: tetratricopeptide repeat protein [Bryobacteraceae bacterium]
MLAALNAAEPRAEAEYERGMAAARLGRWEEARAALREARRLAPRDARFPIELGGVAFRQKRYDEAAGWLRRGLRLAPEDGYTADFLGTIYYLQGNLEAALKYWNRISKPRIAAVRVEPEPRLDPVLLDRALAFAPGEMLPVSGLLAARARVRGLGVFPVFRFHLDAREDGSFDASLHGRERDRWGGGALAALVSVLRGAAYQTVYPEYFNIGRSAINVESLVRWDAQKRRAWAALSGPLGHDPRFGYRLGLDLRDEQWEIPGGGAPHLRRGALSGEVVGFAGRWKWSAGVELARRDSSGASYQLKHLGRVERTLWHVPEHRFETAAGFSSALARRFKRFQAGLATRWLPRMSGEDWAIAHRVRAGKICGDAPFDEWFALGLERDNDLWMRAHIGTRGGRKGNAPMGRTYALSNWEMDKNVYTHALLAVKLSPFVDAGRMAGTSKWLCDAGVQAKLRVPGASFTLTYGKDLRSGRNAFYLMATR